MTDTVLDRVVAAVTAAGRAYNPEVKSPPVAVLWPDEAAQWEPVMERIGARLPVVTLGPFQSDRRCGPAYWIRCVVAGTIDAGLPSGPVVVYLPRVPRTALRAVDDCPPELAPIAELQYRSEWFSHPKGRDWAVRALLSDRQRGLGLDVADDAASSAALLGALDRLLDEPVDRLAHQRIDADFCNQLLNPEPARIMLGWLGQPGYRERLTPQQWAAFVQQSMRDYKLHPERHGEIAAADKLGARRGPWETVWNRFEETPELYPGLPDLLRKARPETLTTDHDSSWPQDNEIGEDYLRGQLREFAALTAAAARKQARTLDDEHAERRRTVWAKLGHAPLAFAVEQLAALADVTAQRLRSTDLAALVDDYSTRGWLADDAFIRSLAAVSATADRDAVTGAADAMYRPWVEDAATAMQALVRADAYRASPPAIGANGVVTVFVDGLRLDIAHRLRERLVHVELVTALAALPTVTETAKPALVPIADGALTAGPELYAGTASSKATVDVLRSLMRAQGVQVLEPPETGDPASAAWTEAGAVDRRGHELGGRLVDHLDDEIERITERVRELLAAGWARVEITTDHGWLMFPSGLPKTELPVSTTVVKKGRCARLKDGAAVDVPTVPWFWDDDVRIAVAPGASCFEQGKQYEHGGISPQECIVPRLVVTAGMTPARGPEITRVTWFNLLCRVEVSGGGDGVRVDLRGLAGDARTSIADTAKETSPRGRVSLVVPDEELLGQEAHLVLVDAEGRILVDRAVVVGKNTS